MVPAQCHHPMEYCETPRQCDYIGCTFIGAKKSVGQLPDRISAELKPVISAAIRHSSTSDFYDISDGGIENLALCIAEAVVLHLQRRVW